MYSIKIGPATSLLLAMESKGSSSSGYASGVEKGGSQVVPNLGEGARASHEGREGSPEISMSQLRAKRRREEDTHSIGDPTEAIAISQAMMPVLFGDNWRARLAAAGVFVEAQGGSSNERGSSAQQPNSSAAGQRRADRQP